VQVLLARAQAAQDGPLKWYEQVLAIDEQNAVALEGKRAVWLDRGDQARARKALEEAADAYREAGRDDLVEEVMSEFRAMERAGARERVHKLEETEEYAAAREVIRDAIDRFGEADDWAPDLERLERAAQMLADYQEASKTLGEGKKETAMRLFAGVVAVDPEYKDAAKLLYEAVSGKDVDRLVAAEEKLAEKERLPRRVGWASIGIVAVGLFFGGAFVGGAFVGRQTTAGPAQPTASATSPEPALSVTSASSIPSAPPATAGGSASADREEPDGGVQELAASASPKSGAPSGREAPRYSAPPARAEPPPPPLPPLSVVPDAGSPSPLDEAADRRRLEQKVFAGRGSVEDIKMLKAICSHMGDSTCRHRAQVLLDAKQNQ
jgi:hypothetical protein